MTATKAIAFISPSIVEAVQSNITAEAPIACDLEREDRRKNWQDLIDHKLIEWGRSPDRFVDENVEAPSGTTIRQAIELAEQFRDQGFIPPDSIVPDANGGIVFERRENGESEVFHVWDDGNVEYQRFVGTRLVERWAF